MNNKKIDHLDLELSHSMAHYLLSIHQLKEEKGYARVTDIAKDLHLTKGSVSTAIQGLKKKGLVAEESDSKFLSLTVKGHDEVHHILTSRTLLFYFLRDVLGIKEDLAHRDSCFMEHLLHQETKEKFFEFMKTFATTDRKKVHCNCTPFLTTLDLSPFKESADFEKAHSATPIGPNNSIP